MEEIQAILDVALDLKRRFATGELHNHILPAKTLFMIFYNQSLRTRNSFEAGMTQLGGHAHYLDPSKIYTPALPGKEVAYTTERVSDVARVLSRMGDGIAIRCYGDPVDWVYGGAHELIRNFAYWADIPVLNMEDDKYHPFQALADILTVKEKFGGFKGVKFVMSWAYSPSVHKPRAVPQSAIIAATMMGMDVVLAHPKGMELDDEVLDACRGYAEKTGGSFAISNDFEDALKGAHVVYPKAWTAVPMFKPPVGEDSPEKAQEIFDANKDWICDADHMALADKNAVYMHCLPADRSFEVTDEVIDGPQSVVFDEAENRLHVQKAVMSLVMGRR
ncbi:MAG TPA: N-acetylornithine carbamoyltransferase [Anaerolineae bacterium]|nr:N-acetylornithine carbamoyltransferase [Anaerolineae bacterium]HIQ04942.1 N-acetylornithine carbamoyltransferase [Anaerolineae bacterium]